MRLCGAELGDHVVDVHLDRLLRDPQCACDLPVGAARGDEVGDLRLAAGQPARPRRGAARAPRWSGAWRVLGRLSGAWRTPGPARRVPRGRGRPLRRAAGHVLPRRPGRRRRARGRGGRCRGPRRGRRDPRRAAARRGVVGTRLRRRADGPPSRSGHVHTARRPRSPGTAPPHTRRRPPVAGRGPPPTPRSPHRARRSAGARPPAPTRTDRSPVVVEPAEVREPVAELVDRCRAVVPPESEEAEVVARPRVRGDARDLAVELGGLPVVGRGVGEPAFGAGDVPEERAGQRCAAQGSVVSADHQSVLQVTVHRTEIADRLRQDLGCIHLRGEGILLRWLGRRLQGPAQPCPSGAQVSAEEVCHPAQRRGAALISCDRRPGCAPTRRAGCPRPTTWRRSTTRTRQGARWRPPSPPPPR